ncbi:hypothetical protein B5807_05237 [Epicoccum nigrum]|uniref:Uncharacterized protein n=1 Tax=Epicoccum nigrum TaxID=105696 RepID=A0A1Y2M2H9_EPING|nr:hypothetical protein B5807_05237 [Epicoccum nigrum]
MGSDCFRGWCAPALSQRKTHLPWLLPARYLAFCPPTSLFIPPRNIAIVIQTPHLQGYLISIVTANMNGTSEQRRLGPVEVDGHFPRPDDSRATGGRSATYPPAPYPLSRVAFTQPPASYTVEIGTQSQWEGCIHIWPPATDTELG